MKKERIPLTLVSYNRNLYYISNQRIMIGDLFIDYTNHIRFSYIPNNLIEVAECLLILHANNGHSNEKDLIYSTELKFLSKNKCAKLIKICSLEN